MEYMKHDRVMSVGTHLEADPGPALALRHLGDTSSADTVGAYLVDHTEVSSRSRRRHF